MVGGYNKQGKHRTWREGKLQVKKFVDDNLQLDKVEMLSQNTYDDGNGLYKNVRATETEGIFQRISTNAKSKGLLVNAKKTNLLVVSASRSYEARAHIYDENNNRIDSTDTLKTLGFIFNNRGDISS